MSTVEVGVTVQIGGVVVPAGRLFFHRRKSESASFTYAPSYLARRDGYSLDPDLPLFSGPQSKQDGNFGAFRDSAPDRWGRKLLTNQERQDAASEGRTPRSLGESDFLLGVGDVSRQGAIRYTDADGRFLSSRNNAVPTLLNLPGLLEAAERIEQGDWEGFKELVAAGAGSGGARPKAAVTDRGQLFIAKFPSPDDDYDVSAWEDITLVLARKAGINAAKSRLHLVEGNSVLLLERFDRVGDTRLGYMSAMTLMRETDGAQSDYVDMADESTLVLNSVGSNLNEMWRRIAFSVMVNNTDDHLRNHGFLRVGDEWTLAPAFDINPSTDPHKKRATSIMGEDSDNQIEALVQSASAFRLNAEAAKRILGEVADATSGWKEEAERRQLPAKEITRMHDAYESRRDELKRHISNAQFSVPEPSSKASQPRTPKGQFDRFAG